MFPICIDADSKCYDSSNKLTNIKNIKVGSKIQVFIEFDSIIFGSTECSRRWRVLQLKEEQSIDMNINLFNTPTPHFGQQVDYFNQAIPQAPPMIHQTPNYGSGTNHYNPPPHVPQMYQQYQPYPQVPQSQYYPNQNQNQNQISSQKYKENVKPSGAQGYAFIAPTQSQLQEMMSKLKKTIKKEDEIDKNKDDVGKKKEDDDSKQPQTQKKKDSISTASIASIASTPSTASTASTPSTASKTVMTTAEPNLIVKPFSQELELEQIQEQQSKKESVSKYIPNTIFCNKIKELIQEQTKLLCDDNKKSNEDVFKINNIISSFDILIKKNPAKTQIDQVIPINPQSVQKVHVNPLTVQKVHVNPLTVQKVPVSPMSVQKVSVNPQTVQKVHIKSQTDQKVPVKSQTVQKVQIVQNKNQESNKPPIKMIKKNVPLSDDEFDPFEKSND